jgi:hypothetical protein
MRALSFIQESPRMRWVLDVVAACALRVSSVATRGFSVASLGILLCDPPARFVAIPVNFPMGLRACDRRAKTKNHAHISVGVVVRA